MVIQQAKQVWKKADAVCFDVDSTVVTDEGIDELATFCGKGKEVSQWTTRAMGGGMSFRTALRERLGIINATREKFHKFIERNPVHLTPGIRELVITLQKQGTAVYLVSGGFRRVIQGAAKQLNIPDENVFANRLQFDDEGHYCGFDETELTSDSGGKTKVLKLLKEKFGYKSLVMIGDGATDLETFPSAADTFIGFGGNVVREKVKAQAPWYVTDFKELIKELDPTSQSEVIEKGIENLRGASEHLLNGMNGASEHLITGVNGKHYI